MKNSKPPSLYESLPTCDLAVLLEQGHLIKCPLLEKKANVVTCSQSLMWHVATGDVGKIYRTAVVYIMGRHLAIMLCS